MAAWKDLYQLMGQGLDAVEIARRLNVPPSRLGRMLRCRRLRGQLELDRQMASMLSGCRTARASADAAQALCEIVRTGPAETARKASMAVIRLAAETVKRDRLEQAMSGMVRPGPAHPPIPRPELAELMADLAAPNHAEPAPNRPEPFRTVQNGSEPCRTVQNGAESFRTVQNGTARNPV